MGNTPKISVVMITYNHEKYIREAIDSILSQTFADFELIIVDDGSKDNTSKIIREYKDSRIIVIEQENSGPSIALNIGIGKSRGQFIAFMSGDDVSLPDRLMAQMGQVNSQNADMVFCLPQIIGPDSNILDNSAAGVFFNSDFESTAELFHKLFFLGNFLCAPSCFCRRSAIEKIGTFKRGLIQLQDFDYWIRACKKKLVIKLHKDPLIQYRTLFGDNLSADRNLGRINFETVALYKNYFEDTPIDLLHHAFGEKITLGAFDACPEIEIDKAFLFLEHSSSAIRAIGMEQMIELFENDEAYERLRNYRNFNTTNFFQLLMPSQKGVVTHISELKEGLIQIKNILLSSLRFIFTEGPKWTDAQVKQHIQYYLERGDHRRALMVLHGYRRFPPGPTIFATLLKVFNKIIVKIRALLSRIISIILNNTRNPIAKVKAVFAPSSVIMTKVFFLSRMYDYSKKNKYIIYEASPEKIYLKKPKVTGSFAGTLFEGNTFSPQVYVSIINNAIITGGSSLVVTQEDDLLSDEMVDFSTEDFGIKSPHVSYRYEDKVILTYRKRPNTYIREGILLSCDHDANYFHWLVECLPKLLLIDELEQFRSMPLLIPSGLHENLKEALKRVNIYNHPVINLEAGVAYHVDQLVFPSALSRIVDRYMGGAVFDADIILSHKWISRVANLLRNNAALEVKPWRKIYLTRKKGLRGLGNRVAIETLMIDQGFEVVDLDDMTLDIQIKLFSQVRLIVAPTGAALTNMLFCQPGTKVIIFMSNHEVTNYYFWSNLGAITNLDVTIIAGERLFNTTNYWSVHDDYVIDANIVLEEIMKYELQ